MKTKPLVLVVAVVIVAAGTSAYYAYQANRQTPEKQTNASNQPMNINRPTTSDGKLPATLQQFITQHQNAKDANPPFGVSRCVVDGAPYYNYGGGGPDSQSALTDSAGTYLCVPFGGFTGRGAGDCNADELGIVSRCSNQWEEVWNSQNGYKNT